MSTALNPRALLPDWMQTVSTYNPISITVDAVRAPMITGFDAGTILTAFGVIGLIGLITMGATLYLFRKLVS
jgi:ABC-type polysaccharide/polyol phosphate export permease